MTDLPWDDEASLVRTAAGVENEVRSGPLCALVAEFLDFPSEQQQGLTLRVAGKGWMREYGAAAIRELAAQPGFKEEGPVLAEQGAGGSAAKA